MQDAAERLRTSLLARYGALSGERLRRLTQANMKIAADFV